MDSVQKSQPRRSNINSVDRHYSTEIEYINNNRNVGRRNDRSVLCRIMDKLGFTSCCNNIQNDIMTDLEVNDM